MTEESVALTLPRRKAALPDVLSGVLTSARFYVYLCCTVLALLTAYHLGKEMLWDTLNYHFYAGFSALHDRFALDYFPAAWQGYLNPYAYAPFYVLATSGLTALQVALVLAGVQSGILWLTYEMALAVVARDQPKVRLAIGVFAAALAFANPVLIDQFGSSFADVTTAEVVLAGWLLLLGAVRVPHAGRVACAALLLGAASALKLTNAVHAVSAGAMLLFLPGDWKERFRYAALFVAVLGAGFVIVSAPWSIPLERHFGNPEFPLLNGIFRSPYFTTAPLFDYRFIPTSIWAPLLLPFTMISPRSMIHVEWAAPDLRYALLLVLAVLSLASGTWKRVRRIEAVQVSTESRIATRMLAALGCAFLADWMLWVTASANSRYFIPMACVAAVLGVTLAFRLFAENPKARNYVLAVAFAVQFFQLHVGTEYHSPLPWKNAPWFDVSTPPPLASQPTLYLSLGQQSNSFVVPYVAPGSGIINLQGIYTLGADGRNGRRIQALVRKYLPHVRVLVRDLRPDPAHQSGIGSLESINDALEPFGLSVDDRACMKISVHGVTPPEILVAGAVRTAWTAKDNYNGYLVACSVVPHHGADASLVTGELAANLALDHLEDACPSLFQPRRMATYFLGDKAHGYYFVRRYPNTDIAAWVSAKWVRFQKMIGGGQEQYAGPESAWGRHPLRVACGRSEHGVFFKVLQPFK